jgi:hypothetical protein
MPQHVVQHHMLKEGGYKANLYVPCVWKEYKAICFHMDDCKVLHILESIVEQTIKWLRKNYESILEDGVGR